MWPANILLKVSGLLKVSALTCIVLKNTYANLNIRDSMYACHFQIRVTAQPVTCFKYPARDNTCLVCFYYYGDKLNDRRIPYP
jgi:hypothetical protein